MMKIADNHGGRPLVAELANNATVAYLLHLRINKVDGAANGTQVLSAIFHSSKIFDWAGATNVVPEATVRPGRPTPCTNSSWPAPTAGCGYAAGPRLGRCCDCLSCQRSGHCGVHESGGPCVWHSSQQPQAQGRQRLDSRRSRRPLPNSSAQTGGFHLIPGTMRFVTGATAMRSLPR